MVKVKVKLRENTEVIEKALSSIEASRKKLQNICDALVKLGADGITIRDLKEVIQMDGAAPTVKDIVFRGKTLLTTDGFKVNSQAIQLEPKALKAIMLDAQSASRTSIDYTLFDVTEDAVVIPIAGIEEKIHEANAIYSTKETAGIIDDVQKVCDLINQLRKKMAVTEAGARSPLGDPELWLEYKIINGKGEFTPNVPRLVGHLEPTEQDF
jgi:hypothetical protein